MLLMANTRSITGSDWCLNGLATITAYGFSFINMFSATDVITTRHIVSAAEKNKFQCSSNRWWWRWILGKNIRLFCLFNPRVSFFCVAYGRHCTAERGSNLTDRHPRTPWQWSFTITLQISTSAWAYRAPSHKQVDADTTCVCNNKNNKMIMLLM